MNIDQNTELKSLDDLLDGTLDDLADMPAFSVFPAGAHHVKITWDLAKEIAGQKCIAVKLSYIAAVELSNPEDKVPAAGDECELGFLFKNKDGSKNEFAEGNFKQLMTDLKGFAPEGSSPRAIMEATNGAEVLALTDVRLKDKKDPTSAKYLQIKNFASLT